MTSCITPARTKATAIQIFKSKWTERFFFSIVCATAFTSGLCHWILDLGYRYLPSQENSLHVEFTWVFWICTIVSLYYLIKDYFLTSKIIKLDFALLFLVQTLVLAGVLDYHNEYYTAVPYAWILPMAYIIGKYAIGANKIEAEKNSEKIYLCLAFGIFICLVLDFYKLYIYAQNWQIPFSEIYLWRFYEWPGFFTGELQNRCTMELGTVMILGTTGYSLMKFKIKKRLCLSIICSSIVCVVFSIQATGRSVIVLLALSISVFLIILLIDNRTSLPFKIRQIGVVLLLIFIAVLMIFHFALSQNWFGLQDKYLSSYWSREGGILKNVRFSMDWNGFKAMLQYPLEDYESYAGLPKSHSMLLEYGRAYDITIYIGLVLFRIITFIYAFLLVRDKNSEIKYLLIPSFVIVNAYYSIEPNGYALRYLWMIGLLISGLIAGNLKNRVESGH